MGELSSLGERRVAYVEVKSLGMLSSEITQSGTFTFSPPATLIREIREPMVATYVIDGQSMTVTGDRADDVVQLDSAPLLQAFIESFRATLAGDIDRLEEYYSVEFAPDEDAWTMELRPRSRLRRFIDAIVLTGDGTWISDISIREADGDSSKITMTAFE